MLVLSRKAGEELVIDGNVRVKVIEVSGNRVRVAICAPSDVAIRRSEISPTPASAEADEEFSVLLVGN